MEKPSTGFLRRRAVRTWGRHACEGVKTGLWVCLRDDSECQSRALPGAQCCALAERHCACGRAIGHQRLHLLGGMGVRGTEGHRIVQDEAHHLGEGAGHLWPGMRCHPGGSQPHPNVQESCFSANNSQKALLAEHRTLKELHRSRPPDLRLLTGKRAPGFTQLSSLQQCDQTHSKAKRLVWSEFVILEVGSPTNTFPGRKTSFCCW